jgi:hypothetical protein
MIRVAATTSIEATVQVILDPEERDMLAPVNGLEQ